MTVNKPTEPPPPQAPEAQLGRVSMAGDVYSFGITLWEM